MLGTSKKLKKIEARVTEEEFQMILTKAIEARAPSLSEYIRKRVVSQSRTLSDTKKGPRQSVHPIGFFSNTK